MIEPSSTIPARMRDALHAGIDALSATATDRGPRRSLREAWRSALALEHLILSDLLSLDEERGVLAGMDPARIQTCQEIFCALETWIEDSFAALALEGGDARFHRADSITENYLVRYEALARHEVALAGITSSDRVRFIGSGPLPITAVEYVRQTGCVVECVDFVDAAVETSCAVIRRLGLEGSLEARHARGEDLSAEECSVVLVGVLARPKERIFDTLEATCPPGCRVIARTTFGLREVIYAPAGVDESRLRALRPAGAHVARGDQVISSRLYKRSTDGRDSRRR